MSEPPAMVIAIITTQFIIIEHRISPTLIQFFFTFLLFAEAGQEMPSFDN